MKTTDAAIAFGALAAETRVDVLRRLVAAGGDGLRSGDLATAIGVSAPNMSFHLKELQRSGLIAASRDPANALPAAVRRFERGIDLYYFANALVVDDDARALLAFSKLREDANNTTAMAACCGTLMCGVHPAYLGHSISVNADSCGSSA